MIWPFIKLFTWNEEYLDIIKILAFLGSILYKWEFWGLKWYFQIILGFSLGHIASTKVLRKILNFVCIYIYLVFPSLIYTRKLKFWLFKFHQTRITARQNFVWKEGKLLNIWVWFKFLFVKIMLAYSQYRYAFEIFILHNICLEQVIILLKFLLGCIFVIILLHYFPYNKFNLDLNKAVD